MSDSLALEDVRVGYGPVEVLHGVTLTFPVGSVVALVGRNGAGRSTALRTLAGLVPVRSGRVWWRNRDITGLTPYERAA